MKTIIKTKTTKEGVKITTLTFEGLTAGKLLALESALRNYANDSPTAHDMLQSFLRASS